MTKIYHRTFILRSPAAAFIIAVHTAAKSLIKGANIIAKTSEMAGLGNRAAFGIHYNCRQSRGFCKLILNLLQYTSVNNFT